MIAICTDIFQSKRNKDLHTIDCLHVQMIDLDQRISIIEKNERKSKKVSWF